MQTQTLEELKAENANTEEEAVEESVSDTVEPEVEAAEETTEEVEQVAEPDQEESEEETVEAWMQAEEQGSEKEVEAKFTGSDIKAARLKERAKAEKRSNKEIDELRAEIAALKSQSQPAKVEAKAFPKLEDYEYDEAKYQQAVNEYTQSSQQASYSSFHESELEKARMEQAKQKLNQSVDAHYERATELISKHGINPDVYKQSDHDFRDAIDEIMPDKGDLLADGFIATLGEGSEKAIYRLARNKAELRQFQNKLASDPSGLQAMAYLGEIKARSTMPVQRKSSAPKPATKLNGGSGGAVSEASFRKNYDKAHKSGNGQAAFNAKREAKAAGIDTSKW